MTFKRFEEIEAWKLARELCQAVKQLTEKEQFSKDWTLRNQILAASGSVMDCIAEGHERGQTKEFKYFLGVAKGSCGEVRSQAYRAQDFGYITSDEFIALRKLCLRTAAAIQGLIAHLKSTKHKGNRENHYPQPAASDQFFPSTPPPETP